MEEELLARLRRGELSALDELIDLYGRYVSRIVSTLIGAAMTAQDVEEVVSDVFFTLWRQADRVRPGRLKGYLSSIARNQAINKLRERRQELALEEDVLPALDGPEQAATAAERREILKRALDEMGEPEREIFLRHYYYGQTVAAIGLEMQMNVSTVKSRLSDDGNAAGLDFTYQGTGWVEKDSIFTRVDDHTLEYTGNYTFTDCTALESIHLGGLWVQDADKGYTQVFAGDWTLPLSGLKRERILFDASGKQFQLYVKPVENSVIEDDWPGGNVTMTLTSDLELTPLGIYCDYDEYPPELAADRDEPYTLRSFGALCKVYYTDGTEGEVPYDLSQVEKVVVWDQLELFVP